MRQDSIRLDDRDAAVIDELVKAYNANSVGKVSRHTVLVDLIRRGIRTIPKKKAQTTANASSPSESNAGVVRPSGEEAP